MFTLAVSADTAPYLDLSIEGLRSQRVGAWVFVFMLLGVIVFASIVYSVAFGKFAPKSMRLGEKILFGAIIMGIVFGVTFGALQMLSGYLF